MESPRLKNVIIDTAPQIWVRKTEDGKEFMQRKCYQNEIVCEASKNCQN